MTDETREAMQLFVEKALRVLNGPYMRYLHEHESKWNINWTLGGPVKFKHVTPDTDAVDALVMTFRMFMQKHDRISLRDMTKIVDDPDVSQEWKDHFTYARSVLNKYLDGSPAMDLRPEGKMLTGKVIVETFLYGEYAHTEKKHRDQYLKWKQDALMFSLICFAFDKVVIDMLKTINYVCGLCELELEGKPIPSNPEMNIDYTPMPIMFKAELKPNTENVTAPVIVLGNDQGG